ncbi:hypothetical protein ABKY47_003922 [Aeromonas hydrophila]
MKRNERTIQFFDLVIVGKTKCRDINHSLPAPVTFDAFLKQLKTLRTGNNTKKQFGEYEFNLEDIKEYEKHWILMLNVLDVSVADQVTQKIGGNISDREVIEFRDGRGIETSSHMVIYKDHDIAHKHLVLYEKSSNIPFQKASSYLNYLAKMVAHKNDMYKRNHPSNVKGKTYNTYCDLTFYGHPSNEFKKELSSGKISGIRITSDADIIKGYDSSKFPELISNEIKMKVSLIDVTLAGGNWGYLKKAISYADTLNAPFVRVQFKDEHGNSHSATLSADSSQLYKSDKYVKKAQIQYLGDILRTAYDEIQTNITDKMLELVK